MGLAYTAGILLITYLIQESFGNDLVPIPFSVRAVLENPLWNCKTDGWSCRDCNTRQLCYENTILDFTVKCADQFPTLPFCDTETGKCTNDRQKCQEITTGFKCPDKGVYPDLTDCRKYVSCAGEDDFGVSYNCLYASVYNHDKMRCITGAKCYTATTDCAGKYKTIPYPPDKSLYVVCRGLQAPILRDCKSKSFVYNAISMACEFNCREEGHFPDPFDKKSFYICVRNGTVLIQQTRKCRENTSFDELIGGCVLDIGTNEPPSTQAPTTQAPTTQAPTTQAPTTQAPTTQEPSSTTVAR